jgi:hypothetical protein
MIIVLKITPTLRVPGNSGNKHAVSYQFCSRRSHLRREQAYRPGHFRPCSQVSRERREQLSKLSPYLFPLFPGTRRDVSYL